MNDYGLEDIYDIISIGGSKKSSGLKRLKLKSPLDIQYSLNKSATIEYLTDDSDRDDNFELLNDKVESMNQKLNGQDSWDGYWKGIAENGNDYGNGNGIGHGNGNGHENGHVRVDDMSQPDLQYYQNQNRVYDVRDQVLTNSHHSTKSPSYSKDSSLSSNANIFDRFVRPNKLQDIISNPSDNAPLTEFEVIISNPSLDDDTLLRLNENMALAIAGKVQKRHYAFFKENFPPLKMERRFAKFLIVNFKKLNIKSFISQHRSSDVYLPFLTNFRLYLYACVYNQGQFWEMKYLTVSRRLYYILSSNNLESIIESLPPPAHQQIEPPVSVPKVLEISLPQIRASYQDSPLFPNSSSFHPKTQLVSKMSIPRYVYRRLDLHVPEGAAYQKPS